MIAKTILENNLFWRILLNDSFLLFLNWFIGAEFLDIAQALYKVWHQGLFSLNFKNIYKVSDITHFFLSREPTAIS